MQQIILPRSPVSASILLAQWGRMLKIQFDDTLFLALHMFARVRATASHCALLHYAQ